jgi:4'-phosphopantetheinyl transferase
LPQTCDVDVWLVSLERDADTILSPDEELRAARLRFEHDRIHWIRAHSALRAILSVSTGLPPLEIRFVTGPNGKPALMDGHGVEFNLSHSGDWAMVAVTNGVPVGVDIERIRENVDMPALLQKLGERDLPESRPDLYRVWTRREARTKAVGGALFERPAGDFRICDLDAPTGYSAALALIGHDPRIRYHSTTVPPATTFFL